MAVTAYVWSRTTGGRNPRRHSLLPFDFSAHEREAMARRYRQPDSTACMDLRGWCSKENVPVPWRLEEGDYGGMEANAVGFAQVTHTHELKVAFFLSQLSQNSLKNTEHGETQKHTRTHVPRKRNTMALPKTLPW
jgi:hypothetical protein